MFHLFSFDAMNGANELRFDPDPFQVNERAVPRRRTLAPAVTEYDVHGPGFVQGPANETIATFEVPLPCWLIALARAGGWCLAAIHKLVVGRIVLGRPRRRVVKEG